MTRGHEPVLATRLVERLESYEHTLPRLPMPEPTRIVIAAELRAALQDAIEIDENEVTAIYHLRTGRMPRRVEREERAQQKRPA